MESIQIKGSLRKKLGKSETKKLRKEEKVPCVLYGGKESVHFSAYEKDFRHLIYTSKVYLVNLDLDGKAYQTILQDIQFHPVTDKILHVDFYETFEDVKIKHSIPIRIEGFAEGIKAGGKLYTMLRKLKVKALPKDLPNDLEINIEKLELGDSIKIRDLEFDNLELLDPQESVVCAIRLTRVAKGMEIEEPETEEEIEGEEGEAATDATAESEETKTESSQEGTSE